MVYYASNLVLIYGGLHLNNYGKMLLNFGLFLSNDCAYSRDDYGDFRKEATI